MLRAVLGLATAGLLIACAATVPPAPPAPTPTGPAGWGPGATSIADAPAAFTFRFQVGDEVSIDVWQEEELSTVQRILHDGTLAPMLLGTVHAAGKTIDELKAVLTQGYRTYLKDPKVSVHVTGIYSDRVFVLGEIGDPQAVPYHGPTTVLQAIAYAGGFAQEFADLSQVRLIRRGPGGEPLVYGVDVASVIAGRAVDPPVQRGDIVFVPPTGTTDWARTVGQALSPISSGLGVAGSIAGTVALATTR